MNLTERQETRLKNSYRKDEKTGCWEWTAGKDQGGYGRFSMFKKKYQAHRIMYQYYNGPIEEGKIICHDCDNPGCVNPKHLYAGTNKDNARDRVERGRSAPQNGSNNGNAKLSEAEIKELVSLLPLMTNKAISAHFNGRITHSMVSRVRLGKSWSEFTGIKEGTVTKYESIKK